MLPICVVNNYGQFNHLIHRALRDLDIDVALIPNTTPKEEVMAGYRGIILGGGPAIERSGKCAEYLDLGLPVLGICLGLHIIAKKFGGEVHPGKSGGYGFVEVSICDYDDILAGYPEKIPVWASHADEVCRVPEGFTLLARSGICEVEAIACPKRRIYGLQWHPEVSHTVDGKRVYENFDAICRE
ncbi:MAG: GMP synthase subunit A [Methanoregula sp.]|jgi:GMP synthase (glutamine-hydrolysing)|uniref:GMP synthase subunit A n=1 Tax=Methanoregula sp. TaxID=2052170 RepID=UPI003C214FF9